MVGLGLYVSSRVAECPYCSAHTCSFALRRGASPETLLQAIGGTGKLSAPEAAVVVVARSLARIPSEVRPEERQELEKHYGAGGAEWIVAGVCMMGFLNKFMDAIGVELEAPTAAEVARITGALWKDHVAGRSLGGLLPALRRRVIPSGPSSG